MLLDILKAKKANIFVMLIMSLMSSNKVFNYPKTVNEILVITEFPVVAINNKGIFTFINKAFENQYGWTKKDLLERSVTAIMPKHMRHAHNVGFSRFLTTESPTILSTPLNLSVEKADGQIVEAEHFILGEQLENKEWRFAAIIKPLNT